MIIMDRYWFKYTFFFVMIIVLSFSTVHAIELSLSEALKIACDKSSRSEIIAGDLEVAEQNYHAEMYISP